MVIEKHSGLWNREGDALTVFAMAVSLIVIVGGLYIFNAASREYRVADSRIVVSTAPPVLTPSAVPVPGTKPAQ